MVTVEGRVDVRCSLEEAWELFSRFGDVATLIPSVESVEVDGDVVHAKLCTKLGALPVSSRVRLQVVERKHLACLKAEGISYLGETVRDQVAKVRDVDRDSVGRMSLHLDLRPTDSSGRISIIYSADVEAEGRLKRIYQAILKTKVPAMMEEFAENLRGALEVEREPAAPPTEPAPAAAQPTAEAKEPPATVAPEPGAQPTALVTVLPVERSWWRRLLLWLRGLFVRREGGVG